MAPAKQRAAIVTENGIALGIVDVPTPGPGQILVRVAAAAQNPVDWKATKRARDAARYGGTVGNDFAGTVEELGPDVPEGVRKVGERVAGFIMAQQGNGSYAEYLVAEAELGIVPIPDGWSFEEAAQLGIAPLTALHCLHQSLELPSPLEVIRPGGPQRAILIWGGASSVGQYAIQYAKLGGFRVLTTTSPKNIGLVRGLGADEVFDYRDEDVVDKIRAATANALDIAIDTISEGKTPKQVTGAIGDEGGKVASILPYESPRSDVKVILTWSSVLLDRGKNGKWFVDLHSKILATGKIKPNPIFVQPNGIAGVKDGLQYMQEGKVSAQKLTYRISDTPEL